ncbi:MAG: hypothetical protein ABIK62_04715, partial [candidate division WOR-3 bacterium]
QAAGHFLAAGDSVLAHAVELKTRLPRRSPELAFWLSTFVPGDYYWTLEAIDDLGNSVRTAEEHFSVH